MKASWCVRSGKGSERERRVRHRRHSERWCGWTEMITLKAALFKLFNVTLSVYSLRFYIFSQFCSLFAYASRSRSDVCKIYQRDRVAFSTHSRNALFLSKIRFQKKSISHRKKFTIRLAPYWEWAVKDSSSSSIHSFRCVFFTEQFPVRFLLSFSIFISHYQTATNIQYSLFYFDIRNSPTHALRRPDEMMNGKARKKERTKQQERKEDRHKNLWPFSHSPKKSFQKKIQRVVVATSTTTAEKLLWMNRFFTTNFFFHHSWKAKLD